MFLHSSATLRPKQVPAELQVKLTSSLLILIAIFCSTASGGDIQSKKPESVKLTVEANPILDEVLITAQNGLLNYTVINLPPFSYLNPLCSVSVPQSAITGLVTFNRVGDVVIQLLNQLATSTVQFAFGWTQLSSVSSVDVYLFQFGVPIYAKKGILTLQAWNTNSSQTVSFNALTQSFSLLTYDFTIERILVSVTGFEPGAQLAAQILTSFLTENKDLILAALSSTFMALVNASFTGIHSIIYGN